MNLEFEVWAILNGDGWFVEAQKIERNMTEHVQWMNETLESMNLPSGYSAVKATVTYEVPDA